MRIYDNGHHAPITVKTDPIPGAICELSNLKGNWFIKHTPGRAIIDKDSSDLIISCSKGGISNTIAVRPTLKNILNNQYLVGALGTALDATTGAGYEYPSLVHVPLIPRR